MSFKFPDKCLGFRLELVDEFWQGFCFRVLSWVLLVLLRYSFKIFSSFPLVRWCQLLICPSICRFFSLSLSLTTWFGSSTPSIVCHLPLFITSMVHFYMSNSIPVSWLYILTVCTKVFNPFLFWAKSLISSMYIKWLIFFCDLLSLYPAEHFLRMWLSGIIAITNSYADSASPLNMHLWIFITAKLFPPAINSTLQVCMVFLINSMTWLGISYILWQFSIQLWGTISKPFCCQSKP